MSDSLIEKIYERLSALFGYREFRPFQEEVIQATLAGRDSFTVMPTGGGKSLCYQLPASLLPGACVVVSPLISLMKDQVDAAWAAGLRAAAYNSAGSAGDRQYATEALRAGELDLLYLSPERLQVPDFLGWLKRQKLSFFAIDEAHCISEWGHDFRPDYLALAGLKEEFPGVPLAAFTATATRRVESDIVERLHLAAPLLTRASFNRPNLFYQISPKLDLEAQLLDFLKERQGEAGIIYRTTRKNVEATVAFLQGKGILARAYHAGLPDAERAAVQDAFRNDECPLIVATVAFGMGIDKSNVRFVVHADLPKNLESYYQETGRAGRDGEPAHCALFYGRADIAQLMRFAESLPEEESREIARHQLYRLLDFTQREGCRRRPLLGYFGEEFTEENCGACDVCAGTVEREDATVPAQKLLSAMARTGGRFGARHLIHIVMGKADKRIQSLGHDQLPTFGVGSDREEGYWHRVMDAILAQGLAALPEGSFPTPALTERGWEVLRGQRQCSMVKTAEKAAKKSKAARRLAGVLDGPRLELFELLRARRAELAREAQVPPYVVFSDRSLREMAELLPQTPSQLMQVSGVGQHKRDIYGAPFLAVIESWLDAHPEIAPDPAKFPPLEEERPAAKPTAQPADKPASKPSGRGETWRETGRLLDDHLSIEEVAEARGIKATTVLIHMENLAKEGKAFPPEAFMHPERLAYIRSLFERCGSWQLGPAVLLSREEANEEQSAKSAVDFEEARLARLLLRGSLPQPDFL